jgi:ParB-like chromosome segregation protein Spo0J
MDISDQPVSHVVWVHRSQLKPSGWNPNRVSPIEMDLLEQSLLEARWVFPIVARRDGVILDGEHRWLISAREAVYAMTDGYVPVVYVEADIATQVMHTIRLNRARGVHGITPMAEIVSELIAVQGLSEDEVCVRLGMEVEEVHRLIDMRPLPEKASADKTAFAKGWRPTDGDV